MLVTVVCGYLVTHTYRHQFQLCSALLPWAAGLLAPYALAALLVLRWPLSGLVRRESFSESLVALASQGQPGLPVFTDMNAGGYFLWTFGGRQKVFIDSRTDQVYLRPNFLADYFEIWLGGPRALALLDQYGVQAVANNRLTSNDSALFGQLLKSGSWVRVYSDMIGEFYCRKELAGQFNSPTRPKFLDNFLEGFQFQSQGRWQDAERCWLLSIQDYPQFGSAYQALARLWMQHGKTTQAHQALARAEFYNPESAGLNEDWRHLGLDWPVWLRSYFLPFWAL